MNASEYRTPTSDQTVSLTADSNNPLPVTLQNAVAEIEFKNDTGNPIPVSGKFSRFSTGVAMSRSTNTTGTAYISFASQACDALEIINFGTSTDIEYLKAGTSISIPVPSYTTRLVIGITNADQVSIRRIDQSNTPVTIKAEALSY